MDYDVKCLLSQDNQILNALFHYSSYNVIITINMELFIDLQSVQTFPAIANI